MIIPVDFAQVNLRFAGDALPTGAEMVFGVNLTGFAGGPLDAANDVATAWTDANMDALYVGDVELRSVLVKFGPNTTGAFAETFVSVPGIGANPGVTPNTALLVKKATEVGGRQGRGRMFQPGVPSNQVDDDGNVKPGFLGTANSNYGDFLSKIAADQLPMALLHNEGSPTAAPFEVTSLTPGAVLATQRRRLRR